MDIDDVVIRDGMDSMDFDAVTDMLARANWSKGIKRDEVVRGAQHSALVAGAFIGGRQIGYARAVSDVVRFAYISDVYVDEAYRGRGVALKLMRHIMAHQTLKDVYKWLLKSNADELYKKLGFTPVADPESWMAIWGDRPDR